MRHTTHRLLRRFMTTEGNWRYKGLLLAAFDDAQHVGEAWPTSPGEKRKFLARASQRRLQSQLEADDPDDAWLTPITPVTQAYTPAYAGETRELSAAKSEFKDKELAQGVDKDVYVKRMLLSDSETELDVLWREELLNTVIMGAQPRQIARDATEVQNVSKRKGDVPRGSAQTYASKIAPGAEIENDEEDFDTVAYDAAKYGQGFAVTDDLVDQSEPDVLERQVRFTGAAVENAFNRVWLNELVDNVTNEHDTAGSEQDVTMVNNAAELVEMDDFGPVDTLVMHPEFKTSLFEDSNLAYANRAGSNDVLTNRTFNQILGMELFTASDGTYDSSSQTWGFNADGEIGAVALNREFMGIQLYKDIEVKDFDDPIRDLQGGNARAWFDANWLQGEGGARIEF